METSELRIGAYVMYEPNGEICRVSELAGNKFIRASVVNYPNTSIGRYLAPIVLTEEWLLKFGFKLKSGKYGNYWVLNGFELSESFSVHYNADNTRFITLKYVHQLQNLYFFLTGEELTLKS